ncbi:MAG: TIGR00725 family protein [Candidatus Binataceae bacterium]
MARAAAIAVIGAGNAPPEALELARQAGREIAAHGATLICGGRGGVMEAAARGAREHGGHTIGILPSYDRDSANPAIEFAIATGMGEARNVIVVASADAVIALAGEGGTLAEIGFALKLGRPVVALGAWPQLDGLHRAGDAVAAVAIALELAERAANRS